MTEKIKKINKNIDEPISDGAALRSEVIAAHGGDGLIQEFSKIKLTGNLGGWAFFRTPIGKRMDWRNLFSKTPLASISATVEISLRTPYMTITPFAQEGHTAVYDGNKASILESNGNILESRIIAQEDFSESFFWDDLAAIYFLGYAVSYYYLMPFIFNHEGFETYELAPVMEFGDEFRRLQVVHPDGVNAHTRKMIFCIGKNGLLHHFRYKIDLAKDDISYVQFLSEYEDISGYKFPKRRAMFIKQEPFKNFRRKYRLPFASNQAYTEKIELIP